ncbi:MAG: o-succinylbenzoate--CoA ligase, partial [Nakamurella sp.]
LSDTDPRAADLALTLDAGGTLAAHEDDAADPTALVLATSGSTGNPKGVLLSAGQLAASASATEARLGGPGQWLLTLPAEHIAGMQVLLRAARAGTEPLVLDREKPFAAAGFATIAHRLPGPRRYVSLVPTQLARVLADAHATAVAADVFDAILVGGAATPPSLLEKARAAGLSIVTTYGMTETCGGCVYNEVPLGGVTASINDAGAIVLTGSMVARGYRGRPHDPAFASSGSFVTSDAGITSVDSDSVTRLIITGRVDDVIVSGGVNVAPAAVESAIRALPGIASTMVIGVPDSQWGRAVTALIVPEPAGRRWTIAELRAALTGLPATHRPHRLEMVDSIPQLPSGKPDRLQAASCYLERHIHPAG